MAYQQHDVDPTGDTFLIVENHSSNIYLWFVKSDPESKVWSELVGISEGNQSGEHRIINNDIGPPTTSPSSAPTSDPPGSDMVPRFPSAHDSDRQPSPVSEQLRVRVSSSHLALASSYLNRLLAASKMELLPDLWEEFRGDITQPLLLILRAVHCQTRKIPRSLGFDMMYKVAFLSDYLGCSESVEVFAEIWIRNAKDLLPTTYSIDVPRWICIAWVFRHCELFTRVTCLAIRETKAPIVRYDNSPVDEEVFYIIAKTREEYMEEILTSVFDYITAISRDDSGACCAACAAFILGSLVRQLTPLRLHPQPIPPYFTHNVGDLLKSLRTLKQPRCDLFVHTVNSCPGRCTMFPKTGEVLRRVESKIEGLDLTDYVDIIWVPHLA